MKCNNLGVQLQLRDRSNGSEHVLKDVGRAMWLGVRPGPTPHVCQKRRLIDQPVELEMKVCKSRCGESGALLNDVIRIPPFLAWERIEDHHRKVAGQRFRDRQSARLRD